MAGYKAAVLLILVAGISAVALGLQIDVDVDEVTSHGVYDINYFDEVSDYQEINATVENIGSIGCSYQLEAVFDRSGRTEKEFSRVQEMWQGDSSHMTIRYLPTNYSGNVETELYLTYCGRREKIEEFNYTQERDVTFNGSVEARVVESGEKGASLSFEKVEKGVIMPDKTPPGWKASSTVIENGVAEIDYRAPIFDSRRNMTYKVVSDGKMLGKTEFNLREEDTVIDVLKDNFWKALFILLLALNILLVATGKLKL